MILVWQNLKVNQVGPWSTRPYAAPRVKSFIEMSKGRAHHRAITAGLIAFEPSAAFF